MDADRRQFAVQLDELKTELLAMGRLAEDRVRMAMQALVDRDEVSLADVIAGDDRINASQMEIDARCFTLLALQHPVAVDLRVVVSAFKINADLERVGDLAVNIAEASQRYIQHPPVKPLIDLPRMGTLALKMHREALDAFVQRDAALARAVLVQDDWLDGLKDQVFRELLTYMLGDTKTIEASVDLILISRHLERIGDHATNIAEDVIFIVEARDVRHSSASAFAAPDQAASGTIVERRKDPGAPPV
ncbi:MAG TPA: phosphate signaling complex protein PhoU [Vicinamibacterales bacterium]|jgi:phosphate transport system protein